MHNSDNKNTTQAYLLNLESNRKIPVVGPVCRLGRDDQNDICMSNDTSISRFHTVIKHENGLFIVEDSKSRNGTYLNGAQITEPVQIRDGDMLKIGNSTFWFVLELEH